MVSFLPRPYPDEYFYSVLVRCHIRSANKNFKATILDSLEYSSQKLYNLELPNNLDRLVANLLPACQKISSNFIDDNTLYPFYKILLTPSETWLLSERMRGKVGEPMSILAKLSPDGQSSKPFLQFCPVCLKEDELRYGEAYWHRIHQAPGIFVCTTHSIRLQDSLVPTKGRLECCPANSKNCVTTTTGVKICFAGRDQELLTLAQDIERLMTYHFSFKGLEWLRQRYQRLVVEQNFAYAQPRKGLKFHSHTFIDAVLSFYSLDLWKVVKPDKLGHLEQYLEYCLLACDVTPIIDRVTHILLIKFLSDSLETFFD